MHIRKAPPTRMSDSSVVTVNPIGAASQFLKCSCSVHAANTSFLGASNTRVITNSGTVALTSPVPPLFAFADMAFPPGMYGFEIGVQRIQAGVPELLILRQPICDFLQRAGLEFRRSPLRVTPARNETRRFQNLEVPRNRRLAH